MARTTAYGLSPWGAWFTEALEGFDESGRLSRGKSYANTGKVAELKVDTSGAKGRVAVAAKVKGHSRPWYRVGVEFERLPRETAERVYALIEGDPFLLARIEAGEFPPELLESLNKEKIDLIPRKWSAMRRSCDCPDWGDPCKHMAAVYYMLAREIDRDPSIIFRLRGLDLAARFGRRERPEPAPPFAWELVPMEADGAPGQGIPPNRAPDPVFPYISPYTGYLSSLLPKSPTFCPEDFSVALVEFYHASIRAAAIPPSEADPAKERLYSDAHYSIEIEGNSGKGSFPLGAGRRASIVVRSEGEGERRLGVLEAAGLFLGLADSEGSEGYRFLYFAFRAARSIVAANAFAPVPYLEGKRLSILWRPLNQAADAARALDEAARLDPGLYREAGANLRGKPRGKPLRATGRSLVDLLATEYATAWVRRLQFRPPGERAALRPFTDLFFHGASIDTSKPGEGGLAAAIESWLAVLSLDFKAWRYRLAVEAAAPPTAAGSGAAEAEDAQRRYELAVSVFPGKSAAGKSPEGKAVPLKDAAAKFGDLDALKPAAALSAWLPELRELTTRSSVELGEKRLAAFLAEASGILARLGAEVLLPKELHRALKPRLAISAKVKGGGNLKSYLDLDSVLEYDWKIAIGGQTIDAKDFAKLVKSGRELVAFKDGYVLLDPAEAARLLAEVRAASKPEALDLLAASLSGDALLSADASELLASLLAERKIDLPRGLAATLRPYQERGFRWVSSNLAKGFGCVLADDMGLGKTVQAIGAMLRLAEDGLLREGALVVAPAALLLNWERELARFAPGLKVIRYHGAKRTFAAKSDVILTTYQTAVRDLEKLKERPFSLLVADEAHLLKNSATRQARTMRELVSARRLALSGTPVENRLEDLRSLFDLVLPGYLGGPAEFKRKWRVPIELERDPEAAARLKAITAPFLLRRLKTDKAIISDLPDKIVVDEYASLAPAQAALYESVVQSGLAEAREAGESGDRGARRALVLKLITALKEVCDHPAVYDGVSPADSALSGKCGLLIALLGEILERREKVIVFSQYVAALRLLSTVIEKELGERALLYHGGMGQKERGAAVDSFQTEPGRRIFLVSLKAGGLGLNLTAASRVIHYDLWFNPAVENQATDRAFRIGQTRNVFVHRLVTTGTFEEKIDAMLKSKRELADMSVASGETWLADLDDTQLRGLFER